MSIITTPAESPPRYFRLGELARKWGIHPATFTRYILNPKVDQRTGDKFSVEAIRTPGEWLVPEGAVEVYFARVTASRKGIPAPTPAEVSAEAERRQDQVERELAASAGI